VEVRTAELTQLTRLGAPPDFQKAHGPVHHPRPHGRRRHRHEDDGRTTAATGRV